MKNMDILVPLLLVLSPVCGDLLNFRHYTDSYKATWRNAQAYCREHHTDLVTIRNAKENEFFTQSGWIGLHRENAASPWKWSRGDEIANFTNWAEHESNSENKFCVSKNNERWYARCCSETCDFMCYDEKLVLVKENKTWEEALDHCRSLGGGDTRDPPSSYGNHRYDLATLITPNDHTYAQDKAQEATTDEVWTGLHFLAGEWLWAGGEQIQYQDIPSCPTHSFCGVIKKHGTASYSMQNCQQRRNFFCYKRS